jgi:hypothetical protein
MSDLLISDLEILRLNLNLKIPQSQNQQYLILFCLTINIYTT